MKDEIDKLQMVVTELLSFFDQIKPNLKKSMVGNNRQARFARKKSMQLQKKFGEYRKLTLVLEKKSREVNRARAAERFKEKAAEFRAEQAI